MVGQRLTERLLELGWLSPEPAPGVTPLGWSGFAELGLNLTPITTSRRKPVAFCTEIRGGQHHEHLGGHLGALVRQHFAAQGWLEHIDGAFVLTPGGEQALSRLGVNLEADL
jgi:hypothetical protein